MMKNAFILTLFLIKEASVNFELKSSLLQNYSSHVKYGKFKGKRRIKKKFRKGSYCHD